MDEGKVGDTPKDRESIDAKERNKNKGENERERVKRNRDNYEDSDVESVKSDSTSSLISTCSKTKRTKMEDIFNKTVLNIDLEEGKEEEGVVKLIAEVLK